MTGSQHGACYLSDYDECVSRINAYFHTRPVVVTQGQPLDVEAIIAAFDQLVDGFTCRGSGFVLDLIKKLTAVFVPFRPLGGSSCVQTPPWLYRRHAVINVNNSKSQDCFRWAIISALFPAAKHSERLSSYVQYENSIDCRDLQFPVTPNQIPVFERNNPTIAIHCLSYDTEKKSFSILYLSPEMCERQHKITLLLLDSPDGQKKHFVWVKNLSRLIATEYTHRERHHVCLSCLQVFFSKRVLDEHTPNCMIHSPQQCVYPQGDKAKLSFVSHHTEFPFDFYLVEDFEAFLKPGDDTNAGETQQQQTIVSAHVPSGFCLYRVSPHEDFYTPPFTCSGGDVMEKFFDRVFEEANTMSDILSRDVPMSPLSRNEQAEHNRATVCRNCKV